MRSERRPREGSDGRVLAEVTRLPSGREPGWNMATCAEILRSEFPEIDGQVFDYVTGERHRERSGSRREGETKGAWGGGLQPGRFLRVTSRPSRPDRSRAGS